MNRRMAQFIQSDHANIWFVQLTEVKDEIKYILSLVSRHNDEELLYVKGISHS